MPPSYPIDNNSDIRAIGAEQVANESMRHSLCRVQGPDSDNVRLGKNGVMDFAAIETGPMAVLVVPVFNPGRPAKVCRPVVMAVVVPVRDFVFRGWRWPVECSANYGVQVFRMALSKMRCHISSVAGLRYTQQNTSIAHRSTILVDHGAIHRSQSPKTGRLIARMSRYRQPLFGFISHPSLYGVGDNGAIAITILAARV